MTIEFLPLLTLEATHEYYGGRSPDFAFWMPSGTERLLAGAHVVAKTRDDRFNLLFERNSGGTAFEPLASLAGRTLQVGLRLTNPAFANFTGLPLLPEGGLPLFRNGADPRRLDAPAPLLLDQKHPDDAEIFREGPFCLVEITVAPGFYANPPAFAVPFSARRETLKYYVVARGYTTTEFGQLDVSDAGFSTDSRPEVRFQRVSSSGFTSAEIPAAQLQNGDPNAKVTLFQSQQPVARRAKGRKSIQLERNHDVIVAQLPQPGAAASSADLVIHLSKP